MSSLSENSPIVWIDCEMTGLDKEIDELIEVAVIVTDAELKPLHPGLEIVIKPSEAAFANMNDFVKKMHKKSGLLADLPNGISLEEAQAKVVNYLQNLLPTARLAPLGGNSVATDKSFLEKYMPAVIDHLHYRIIDVSTLKELAKRWYPRVYMHAPAKTGNHRALGDIRDSIDELRYYRKALFKAESDVTSANCQTIASEITQNPTLEV